MTTPHIEIEKPYVGSLTVNEDEKVIEIRLDNEVNLPFWFECMYDLRQREVVFAKGRVGDSRADLDVTVKDDPRGGYKFECRCRVNDWNCEFSVRGLPETM